MKWYECPEVDIEIGQKYVFFNNIRRIHGPYTAIRSTLKGINFFDETKNRIVFKRHFYDRSWSNKTIPEHITSFVIRNHSLTLLPYIRYIEKFVKECHKNQKYGKHSYFYHLDGVRINAIDIAYQYDYKDIDTIQAIALLHDTIEDTEITWVDLNKLFNKKIADSVFLLSHDNENQDYNDYIVNLINKGNKESLIVKLADLKFNASQTDNNSGYAKQRRAKYKLAIHIIEEELKRRCI
jgi:guanosine-3',5'-bis(diphosphate) 3'-pyrophosphohydrolase